MPANSKDRIAGRSLRTKARSATQRDVAKLAKVSQAAVSRTIANQGYVAEDVRSRIIKAAAQLGYRPDPIARGLITGRSEIIAVVMADIINPFYPIALDAITEAAQRRGRQVLLFNAAHDQTVDDLIPAVLQYRVAGIIVTTASLSSKAAEMCAAKGVRVVLLNRYSKRSSAMGVSCDNRKGGEDAGRLLIDAGCRSLAYIGGSPNSSTNADRRSGFASYLKLHDAIQLTVMEHSFEYEWGRDAVDVLLRERPDIDGIFCGDDVIAFGALDCLRYKHSKLVPEDVSVVGFDDVPGAAWSAYNLTTIRQPLTDMVERSLQLLEAEADQTPSITLLPGEVTLRNTVRSPQAGEMLSPVSKKQK